MVFGMTAVKITFVSSENYGSQQLEIIELKLESLGKQSLNDETTAATLKQEREDEHSAFKEVELPEEITFEQEIEQSLVEEENQSSVNSASEWLRKVKEIKSVLKKRNQSVSLKLIFRIFSKHR